MIFQKKNRDIIFFPYRPPLCADNISKQRGGLDCVQGYPNREMSRKADRSALQLTEDASWDEFIFTAVYAANGQRQSAELLNNTRKTTERIKRRAWVGDERFMITHSISSTKQSPLDCDWLVEFLHPRNGAKADQMVEESQTAHTFSTQTGNRLEKGSYVTQILLFIYIYIYIYIYIFQSHLFSIETGTEWWQNTIAVLFVQRGGNCRLL